MCSDKLFLFFTCSHTLMRLLHRAGQKIRRFVSFLFVPEELKPFKKSKRNNVTSGISPDKVSNVSYPKSFSKEYTSSNRVAFFGFATRTEYGSIREIGHGYKPYIQSTTTYHQSCWKSVTRPRNLVHMMLASFSCTLQSYPTPARYYRLPSK